MLLTLLFCSIFVILLHGIKPQSVVKHSGYPIADVLTCANVTDSKHCFKIGKNFYIIDPLKAANWYKATLLCVQQDAHLVTIENEDEWNGLVDYLKSKDDIYPEPKMFWISGTDLGKEGTFCALETGKEVPFTRWASGQPDNYLNNNNCIEVHQSGDTFLMNDNICEGRLKFICRINKKP